MPNTRTTHLADEGAAAGLVPARDPDPDPPDVGVLQPGEAGRQRDAAHQQREGRQELLRRQRLARLQMGRITLGLFCKGQSIRDSISHIFIT